MSIKNSLIAEQFQLVGKIGQGSFGKVYLALDTLNNSRPVAIKTESLHQSFSQLLIEIQNYRALEGRGFPKLIKQGISVENEFIYMATDLMGPSLEDLFNLCGGKFSVKTSLMLFYQILELLESMHERLYIHRDLKPDNIMIGIGDLSNVIHLIDFGLSRLVVEPKTGQHIPFRTGKNLIGTCRYVSINSHLGYQLSRRDDLLTLGYVMINFVKGRLPWQSCNIDKASARYRRLGKMKMDCPFAKLCKGCPDQFKEYMEYCSGLQFEEAADFNAIKHMIVTAA